MTIKIGDIVRVTIYQSLDAQSVLNVLHYVCTGEDISVGEDVLNSWIGNNIVMFMKPIQSNALNHLSIVTQKVWPLPATVPVLSDAFLGAGGIATAALPTECAVCFTKLTTFAGRKFRGRFYLGGVDTGSVAGSEVKAVSFPPFETLATKLYLGVVIGGSSWRFAPCLFHRGDHSYTGLTSARFNPEIRSQRRRQLGKGK